MSTHSALGVLEDSGPPGASTTYTTLVLLHGYAWQSTVFTRLLPFAPKYDVRIVLVNRRGYPGSEPYTDEDQASLQSAAMETDASAGLEKLSAIMKDRARELYDLLVELVRAENIPPACPAANEGGIVVIGWSMAVAWMMGLLAHVASFPVEDVDLATYVRRVIFFDPAYHCLGYAPPPPPADIWNPFHETNWSLEDHAALFRRWASGYYDHGKTLDELERRNPVPNPSPTSETMEAEELRGVPSPHDTILHGSAVKFGVYDRLRKGALYLYGDDRAADWSAVEVRHLWCDRSVWEVIWGVWTAREELDEGKRAGKRMRGVNFLLLKGANHFCHWDEPERTLQAFLVAPTDSL